VEFKSGTSENVIKYVDYSFKDVKK